MNCIICQDEFNLLSKICLCNDCLVCQDCINEMNRKEIFKCPYCRRCLNTSFKLNYLKFFFFVLKILVFPLLLLLIQIIPISYNIKNNNKSILNNNSILDNRILQNIIIYFSFFVIQPIIFLFFVDFLKNRIQDTFNFNNILIFFTSSFIYCTSMIILILHFGNQDVFKNFLLFVIIPTQIIPFLYIYLRIIFDYIYNLLKIIKNRTNEKKIKIHEMILNINNIDV